MSSRSASKERLEELPVTGDKRHVFDENQNIDEMIDFITKETVPDQKLSFMKKGKKKPRSKSGKQRVGPPSKRFNPDDAAMFNPK